MNDTDYQLLSQYIDGELSQEQRVSLKHRLLAEPELNRALTKMQAINAAVVDALAIPGAAIVPEHISALVQPSNRALKHRWPLALAASVVAAAVLVLTPNWQNTGDSYTDAVLSAALENTPSSASDWEQLGDGRQLRPVLSFQTDNGTWCREFLHVDQGLASRGVACRETGQWRTMIIASNTLPTEGADQYRPAGANAAASVAEFMDQHGAGVALSASDEAAVIQQGWQ